jgi:hypothetical protein
MSAIAIGNQRETVKDMVLADYQVPKGVSILQVRKNIFILQNFLIRRN